MNAQTTTTDKYATAARGPAMVDSDAGKGMARRPECHAPSGYRHDSYSGAVSAAGYSPRELQEGKILTFWVSLGWAEQRSEVRVNPDTGEEYLVWFWYVLDVLSAEPAFLRLASNPEESASTDFAVFSHIIPSAQCGAFCGCNLIPEMGARNLMRGDAPMTLPREVSRGVAGWVQWFLSSSYVKRSTLKRLGL